MIGATICNDIDIKSLDFEITLRLFEIPLNIWCISDQFYFCQKKWCALYENFITTAEQNPRIFLNSFYL